MKSKRKCTCILLMASLIVCALAACKHDGEMVKLADTVHQIRGLEEYVPSTALAESFNEKIMYEVVDISWEGDSGVAEVNVSTPDLKQIMSASIETVINAHEETPYDIMLERVKENVQTALNSTDYPILERSIEMDVQKTDDGYVLISNDVFEEIISGSLSEIFISCVLEVFE